MEFLLHNNDGNAELVFGECLEGLRDRKSMIPYYRCFFGVDVTGYLVYLKGTCLASNPSTIANGSMPLLIDPAITMLLCMRQGIHGWLRGVHIEILSTSGH